MSKLVLEKNQAVVVMRTGSSEQLVKIEAVELEAGKVTLDFDAGPRVSISTLKDWEKLQADRRASNRSPGADRPQQAVPYLT